MIAVSPMAMISYDEPKRRDPSGLRKGPFDQDTRSVLDILALVEVRLRR